MSAALIFDNAKTFIAVHQPDREDGTTIIYTLSGEHDDVTALVEFMSPNTGFADWDSPDRIDEIHAFEELGHVVAVNPGDGMVITDRKAFDERIEFLFGADGMRRLLLHHMGNACFGREWIAELIAALRVNERTVRRWAAGDMPVPPGVLRELGDIAAARIRGIVAATSQIDQYNEGGAQ